MTLTTARCRWCKNRIWFGRTVPNDRRMPLDPEPSEGGNVVVDQVELALDRLAQAVDGARVRVLKKGEVVGPDVPRYMSHFATCTKRGRRS